MESIGRRLGLVEGTLTYYRFSVNRLGYKGTLGNFLNEAVHDFFRSRGYRMVREFPSAVARRRLELLKQRRIIIPKIEINLG